MTSIECLIPKVYRLLSSSPMAVSQAKALVPGVDPRDFKERGKPGIRAQLLDIKNKKLEMDFVVRGDENSTHLLNAVSPAWTSALAMANYVSKKFD